LILNSAKIAGEAVNFLRILGMAQPQQTERHRGSSQRRCCAIGLAGLLLAPLLAAPGAAEESKYQKARREHPALFKLYYDETVMAYCGLLTPESEAGFRLERATLLAADPLGGEALRTLRVAGDMAADYAYQDYGLNGQQRWCKSEGLEAYNHFVARFRAQMPEGGAETGVETQNE
jgi:hypothetical protein